MYAVAHAAVPQANVLPAPLSQTLISISSLFFIFAKVIFILSGKYFKFSICGPIFINSSSDIFSKKTIWGFPRLSNDLQIFCINFY